MGEALHATLEDMLVEVDPRVCLPEVAAGGGECRDEHTPVQLLNWAWQMYLADPEHYPEWNEQFLQRYSNDSNEWQCGQDSARALSRPRMFHIQWNGEVAISEVTLVIACT